MRPEVWSRPTRFSHHFAEVVLRYPPGPWHVLHEYVPLDLAVGVANRIAREAGVTARHVYAPPAYYPDQPELHGAGSASACSLLPDVIRPPLFCQRCKVSRPKEERTPFVGVYGEWWWSRDPLRKRAPWLCVECSDVYVAFWAANRKRRSYWCSA